MADAPPIAGCSHPTRSIPGPTHGDPAFPGAVTVPSTIVGGELALSDDSDATYADHAPYGGWTAQTRAFFPGYNSTADRAYTVQARVQRFDIGVPTHLTMILVNQALTEVYGVAEYDDNEVDLPLTPSWIDFSGLIQPPASTSGGLMVVVNVIRSDGGGPDLALRVFDIELCWSQAEAPPIVPIARRFIPPAQLSGRADGLGPLGGAPRLDTRAPSRQSGFHPGGYY